MSETPLIDFDDVIGWAPELAGRLSKLVPKDIETALVNARPEFIEDALNHVFRLADRTAIVDATLAWINSSSVCAYHGTRLTEAEVASVKSKGLLLLEAGARRRRLIRALSTSDRWDKVKDRLDPTIHEFEDGKQGRRIGQVHLTLSRQGLLHGFNHYLRYGSELDLNVASTLLGDAGPKLLAADGSPALIRVAVPGSDALAAANPIFTVTYHLAEGNTPNLVREFLEAWCYRLAHPDFETKSLKAGCGLRFQRPIPAEWILAVERPTMTLLPCARADSDIGRPKPCWSLRCLKFIFGYLWPDGGYL